MPHVIAYTYEADVHCPDCTSDRFGPNSAYDRLHLPGDFDEHAVPYDATDREGNPIHPVFSTDEMLDGPYSCGTCRERLEI
ncbi:MAG: hypothetical protein LBF16_01260 [Pseudomonadales bacterium]|jgi:hypothetical protein|nr:hypothetical protein [Pseudomonadales bacterium]